MDNLILQLLLLICIACLVSTNRRVLVPNPSKFFEILVYRYTYHASFVVYSQFQFSDYPSQCYDGKKAFNVGKYYPQTHRICKQMICREDFTLLLEE